MADSFDIEITGLQEALNKLRNAGPEILRQIGVGLFLEAEAIMARSKTLVPVVTGSLRASGHVAKPAIGPTSVSVTLGYGGPGAPYALPVHENPRAGKTGRPGASTVGQWKYLEQPVLEAKEAIAAVIRNAPGKAFE